jgi:hypothetical protein
VKRIFTDEELAEMGKSTFEAIIEALDGGEIEKGKKLVRRMNREFQAMHDNYVNWITAQLSYIGRTFGEDKILDTEMESFGAGMKPLYNIYEGLDFRRKVQILVMGLRGHLCSMKIEEDDERVIIIFDRCPTGGKSIRGETGYEDFLKLDKPSVATYGRTGWHPYCVHCAVMEILFIERTGEPLFVTDPSAKPGKEPCRFYVYKERAKIPDIFYDRVGKKKPKGSRIK